MNWLKRLIRWLAPVYGHCQSCGVELQNRRGRCPECEAW